jgi:DNA (cytosine-5)-methyltransferase 1
VTLTVGSLFSGIGGLDLGLERAGMEVIWQSEIDPYACRVLNKHWPKVVNHGNIKEIDWTRVERPDVICGGYPCQPFSTAGQRKGEEDPRHLWPWVRECISVLRPRYAILENVRGHLSLGGTTVIREIANLGYCVEWRVVSAASVGANHRRDRIILLAYPNNTRSHTTQINTTETGEQTFNGTRGRGRNVANASKQRSNGKPNNIGDSERRETFSEFGNSSGTSNVADTDDARGGTPGRSMDRNKPSNFQEWNEHDTWNGVSRRGTEMADASGPRREAFNLEAQTDGAENAIYAYLRTRRLYEWWQVEPDVGRVANGVPSRVDRLRGLGNAVVPQVAEIVGRLVMAHAGENQ